MHYARMRAIVIAKCDLFTTTLRALLLGG